MLLQAVNFTAYHLIRRTLILGKGVRSTPSTFMNGSKLLAAGVTLCTMYDSVLQVLSNSWRKGLKVRHIHIELVAQYIYSQ